MANSDIARPNQENLSADHHHHLICWRSIAAGVLITVMAFLMLTALGAGVAGYTADALIERGGDFALASGAGLWLGLSALIALFCGSYFTLRIARFRTTKVGAAHGFVVASVFFLMMMGSIGSAVGGLAGGLSQGFAKMAQGAGNGAADISSSPVVQDAINKAIGASKLKGDPREIAKGLGLRLISGDLESVKSYLAYQTEISEAELDQKANQLKSDFDAAAKRAGEVAAKGLGRAGLSLFVFLLIGYVSAVLGGRTGAHANVDRPFARPTANQRGSMLPYVAGWLVGVPVSLLVLIAMLRAIF